ncbi:radical SAM protein [Vibrio campbellii]|nr:radical SAM protein [Vibrio campbellii]
MKPIDILKIIRQFQTAKVVKVDAKKRIKPQVIQLPLTYNCNSRCSMCNVWNMDHSDEASAVEFLDFISDDIFSEVKSVGINGGEVTLIPNLTDYIDAILKLPKLKHLNIISNGFRGDELISALKHTYKKCKRKGVSFGVIISLDGVGEMHDNVRGVRNAFKKTMKTAEIINSNKENVCDSFELACTVIETNVEHIIELDRFCVLNKLNIKYRLGIENKRIESDKLVKDFSLVENNNLQSVKELFHYLYRRTPLSDFKQKYKYFCIFDWINSPDGNKKRRLGCDWMDRGITLDSRGEVYYCAVESKSLGSLRESNKSGKDIFFDKTNLSYRESIVNSRCNTCIHDYYGRPYLADLAYFVRSEFMLRANMRLFKLRVKLGLI